MNLPKLFEDRMRNLLGDEYEEYLSCYHKPHFGGLRVNTLKLTPEEFEDICPFSIQRIPWIQNGYYYDTDMQPAKHPYYYAGLYYIQEPSAMTPASLLPIEKGDKVLDICAAPGGKSTELGARLGGEGLLVSNDISNSRAKALLKNIELFGIRNALVLSEAPNKLYDYFPEYFDKILIDAPCSGEGMFRKSPAIMKNWEQYGVEYYNKLQKEIIHFAARMLKPGGYMLYSTCTFSPEENEGTISYLLEEFPEFRVVNAIPDEATCKKLNISYDGFDYGKPEWVNGKNELKNCIRLWPHRIDGEGHFIALLKKDGVYNGKTTASDADDRNIQMKSYKQTGSKKSDNMMLSEEAIEFLDDIKLTNLMFDPSTNPLKNYAVHNEKVHLMPAGLPDIKGLRILRQGLLLGEMKKQRFEPSQALGSSLRKNEYDKIINLDSKDMEAIKYLKCESLNLNEDYKDGWYLICVDGYSLGWAKLTKGNFKNKYLPGWRWV
ncbi:RsmB/NOP family class I SAM-dependent RNA methyltransferase [Mobilitalea sibirica]|uniref:RsmB/NOP family class I SAM-dependent RNA methyltransferase n=1 Tax=Mobilitalea sibirica TaxID=1462919 RepID=A0A8J7GZR3_9FIRM|nr:RsmB/NOP family class I SAM-dependent RNA methyltransferase [Mobilitalea sibirica]MBH1941439.1 RsmB/NOP family class I SAM-dependent RNA methyltransferase [Mobilitalea sibirica]